MNLRGKGHELRDMINSAADAADSLSNERTYVTQVTFATVSRGLTVNQFQTLLRKASQALAAFKDDQEFVFEVQVGKEEHPVQKIWEEKVQEAYDAKRKLMVPDKALVKSAEDIEELAKPRKRASSKA
jgi:hypothetical protein